jgi:hypothetical protein
MSTPKIKVYRLEKGYTQDTDNDIQSKVNDELLPFIEKPSKSTDSYFLTGISEKISEVSGLFTNTPKYLPCLFNNTGSLYVDISNTDFPTTTNWILNGFFAPRLGIVSKNDKGEEIWTELSGNDAKEYEILQEIKKVRCGEKSNKAYYQEKDFQYAHPFIFSKNIEDIQYTIETVIVTDTENSDSSSSGSASGSTSGSSSSGSTSGSTSGSSSSGSTSGSTSDSASGKLNLHITLDISKITENNEVKLNEEGYYELSLMYFLKDENSTSRYIENYPVYNGNNHYYKPLIFKSIPIVLTFTGRDSQIINCSDSETANLNWIFNGAGKPIITCDRKIIDSENYELIYSFDTNNSTRNLVVRLTEEFASNNSEKAIKLYYNTYSSLIKTNISEFSEELLFNDDSKTCTLSGVRTWKWSEEDYPYITINDKFLAKDNYKFTFDYKADTMTITLDKTVILKSGDKIELNYKKSNLFIDEDTGELVLDNLLSDSGEDSEKIKLEKGELSLFAYYSQKVKQSSTYISEHENWSLGHLRENPDIFFGEKDYAGDEGQDTDDGTPIYSGLKPNYIKTGYHIHYMKGTVNFSDGAKTVYKSDSADREQRDVNSPETFVRANYSYYPMIGGAYRQKMELVSSQDGYVYRASDTRFGNSEGKRWIQKNDQQQLQYFENWTDHVKVCSQYISIAPNYDELTTKKMVTLYGTDNENSLIKKLTFKIPFVRSVFICSRNSNSENGFELKSLITVNNDKDELLDEFSFAIEKRVVDTKEELIVNIKDEEITQNVLTEIVGEHVTIKLLYLDNEFDKETKETKLSFQIVSIKENPVNRV